MNTTSSSEVDYPRVLIIVLFLGLILRVLFISIHDRPLFSDEKEYDQLAFNLATRATYSYESTPTAYRPVGYPAIVSAIYFALGHHVALVKLFQALLDVLTALVIYMLLAGKPERIRIVGAAAWCFFAPAVFYSSLLLSETIFTSLFMIAVWILSQHEWKRSWTSPALGALLGALTLIKPTILVFVFIVPFLVPRIAHRSQHIILAFLTFLLVLTPWLLRNYLVFGEVAPSSNGGINLMIGNNPTATGAYKYPSAPELFRDSRGEFEVDHRALRYASSYIFKNPTESIWNAAKKTGRLLESEGALLILTFDDAPTDTSTSYRSKYASIPVPWIVLTNLSYFFLVLAGIFGFLSSGKEPLWGVALAALTSWIVIHAVFFGGGRFHFPLMPFMAVYAARFVIEPIRSYQSLSRFRRILAISACTILSAAWTFESYMIFHG